MIDLSGNWTLADAEGEDDVAMAVPGDVHSALLAAGRIPDPCVGRNEYDLRWVADQDWTLTRRFTLPHGAGPWTLVVDVLDTVAEVRINGHFVVAALLGRDKGLDLRDPDLVVTIEVRDKDLRARIDAKALALFLTLEADRPGRFSTNAITLFPGHPAEIVFTPADGDCAAVRPTARDLWSSAQTPGNAR